MRRRRLWEVDCVLRDAILWSSFTAEEIEALARASEDDIREDQGTLSAELSLRRARWVHELTGCENPLSERLDETLSDTHESAEALVATSSAEEVLGWVRGDFSALPAPLAGFVWAVAVDPRPSIGCVRGCLLSRLFTEGIRTLAFGKVEVISL